MLSFNHTVFLEVAKHLSFTKAADVLLISQPAISKQVKLLEEQYKVSLFERKGGTVVLTPAGTILQQHLTAAVFISRQIETDLDALNSKAKLNGHLRLGASTTVALYIIPAVLSAFRKKNPELNISLLNRNSANVLKALLEHEIDLGIIEGKEKMQQVRSEPFLKDEVIPVCAATSLLAKKTHYSMPDLKKITIALREKGSGTLTALTRALEKGNIAISQLKVCMRLGGTEALKNFILADDCIGFLPSKSVAKELASGELKRVYFEGLSITRQFYFIQRHGDTNNRVNIAFIRAALKYYNL